MIKQNPPAWLNAQLIKAHSQEWSVKQQDGEGATRGLIRFYSAERDVRRDLRDVCYTVKGWRENGTSSFKTLCGEKRQTKKKSKS